MENNTKKPKKDSRWDKIRKRYNNNHNHLNITTDNVKKFLELDFIGQNEMKILNGNDIQSSLSPADIMDIRHSSIIRSNLLNKDNSANQIPSSEGRHFLAEQKQELHNQSLERVAINNEIKKFRNELKRYQKLNTYCATNRKIQFNNKIIYENILNFQIITRDFYQTCIKAPLLTAEVSNNDQKPNDLFIENQSEIYPSVRFEKNIEIFNEEENRKIICLNSLYEGTSEEICETSTLEDISHHSNEADKTSSTLSDFSLDDDPSLIEEPKLVIQDIKHINEKPNDLLLISRIGVAGYTDAPETTERDRIIDTLFDPKFYKSTRDYELKVLRKYFQKWLVITNFSKISDKCLSNNENRAKKINEFLTKIRDEKKKAVKLDEAGQAMKQAPTKYKQKTYVDPITLSKKYQHKLKLQQDMIELQKAKLERQERMITELKLSKMFDESKCSKNEIKTELERAVRFGTVKLRGKAKCLQVVGNFKVHAAEVKETEEEQTLQASGNEMPKFLAKMQARALERHLKHEEARQKRERLEKEREEAKNAAEEAKRLEDEQAKKERHEALREKRRQEKLLRIQKEKEHAKFVADVKKANEFYRLKLLKLGMYRFRKLLQAKRRKENHARILRIRLMKRKCFSAWEQLTSQIWDKKRETADVFYVGYIVKYTFRAWKKQLLIAQSKHLVAIDLYELRLSEKILKYWHIMTQQQKLLENHKMLQAASHYDWHLKWKVLEHWQRLHTILRIERETEERRQRWRLKIWELLPDYQPNPDNI